MNGDRPPYPLLALPPPERTERAKRGGGRGRNVQRPEPRRQTERLEPKFRVLQQNFETRRAELLPDLAGAEPEQVLVLETVGTVEEFIRAVARIDGLEFLGEFEEEDIPPDEDFYLEGDPDRALSGTVYLVMTNQQAMEQLLHLWRRFQEDPEAKFEWGLGRFRELFFLLHDIRPWGPGDRLRETGVLDDWQERLQFGPEMVPAEIELWFRDDGEVREAAEAEVRRHVEQAQGQVVTSTTIPEIRYQALLARLPITAVQPLFEDVGAIELVRSERIMFLRPVGQGVRVSGPDEGLTGPVNIDEDPSELGDPVVALLDGVPLEGHEALAGRLVVDDPDEYGSDVPANSRRHGTAMSSLMLHGDLNLREPAAPRKLYLRPILKAGPDWVAGAPESIPDDVLAIDVIHRAVRRLFEDGPAEGGVAPSVRIINLSVCGPVPFTRMLSSWARLLDWLSWRYRVLIVVSAGNHEGEITMPLRPDDVPRLSAQELEGVTIKTLADLSWARRLLPPAESVNALTVGAAHADGSGPAPPSSLRELVTSPSLPAPFSAMGMGYRRAIKPDVLMPGGRSLYELSPSEHSATSTFVNSDQPLSPPGHRVAAPGSPGEIGRSWYRSGTSNAAALASRASGHLYDLLANMRDEGEAGFLSDDGVFTVALKALLVHGAESREGLSILGHALKEHVSRRRLREFASRFCGYGCVDTDRILGSDANRATLIGGGHLPAEQADLFQVPLPPSLGGKAGRRRLTLTLAWLTPVNSRDRRYRRARLWLVPPQDKLRVKRQEADARAVQRGTIQHEILEGAHAVPFVDGDLLTVQVNCAAYAGKLNDPVPYALVMSLEVAPELDVPVFVEMQDRIRPLVAVRPRP